MACSMDLFITFAIKEKYRQNGDDKRYKSDQGSPCRKEKDK